jgi:hypothetical protein
MAQYEYTGDGEMVFPTLSKVVRKGDVFDGPDGLAVAGVIIVSGRKGKTVVEPEVSMSDSADVVDPELGV